MIFFWFNKISTNSETANLSNTETRPENVQIEWGHLHQLHRHSAAGAAGDKGNVQTSKYSGLAPLFFTMSLKPATSQYSGPAPLFFHNVIETSNFKNSGPAVQCSAVQDLHLLSFSAHQLVIVSQHLGPTVHLLGIAYMQNVHKNKLFIDFTYLLFTKNNWY